MKQVEIVRNAILTVFIDEMITVFEARAAALKNKKGSWFARAAGIEDCILLMKTYKATLPVPKEKS